MREGKERIIYDNYDIEEQYRDAVLEDLEEGETLKEQDLSDRMYEMSQIEWELTKADLETFFSSGTWILTGSVGRWDGCYAAGAIFEGSNVLSVFCKSLTDCDYWKIYDINGHFYFKGSHHDGDVNYEIKRLTEKGEIYFELWENGFDQRSEKYVHEQIEKYYSRLPHFAHKMYGVPKMEFLWNESQQEGIDFNYIEIKKNKEGILDKLPNSFPRYSAEQTSDAFADPFIIRDNWIDEGNPARHYSVSGVYQTFESEKDAQTYVDQVRED